MPPRKKPSQQPDLFDTMFDDDQVVRDTSATAYTELSKAMSGHWRRRHGASSKMPVDLYRREAALIREFVGIKAEKDWDNANSSQLEARRLYCRVLIGCHKKNMGYDSRFKMMRAAKSIFTIMDEARF